MTTATIATRPRVVRQADERINWIRSTPFILMHLAPLGAIFTGTTVRDWLLCAELYYGRMFFVSAGLHRYFSHKSYHATRWFQFVLAFGSCLPAQKAFLWWASWHRVHHRVADKPEDVHSPSRRGFWWSHLGWILCDKYQETQWHLVKQWTRYPELVWLNRLWLLPPILLGFTVWLVWGWSALFIGFFLSTVLLYHGTDTINSLSHVWLPWSRHEGGVKNDNTSQNSILLFPLHMGENWHSDHHENARPTKQGKGWWKIDGAYYVLWLLNWSCIPILRRGTGPIKLGDVVLNPIRRRTFRPAPLESVDLLGNPIVIATIGRWHLDTIHPVVSGVTRHADFEDEVAA